jgi:hypothetical protein
LPEDSATDNMDEEEVNNAKGLVSSFAINVITRQNTSWQGFLDWLDGTDKKPFNSDLELLDLVRECIDKEDSGILQQD